MTMKRLIFIMTILLTTFTKSFSATYFIVDGIKYSINYDNVSVSVEANGYSGDIVIPELVTYNNKKYIVNRMDTYAFKNCPSLKSITVPPTISYFYSNYGMQGTDSLERIYMSSPIDWSKCNFKDIPKDCILYVDGNPFVGDVTFNTDIPYSCFEGYDHFTSVTIENGCTSIDASAFKGCNKLKKMLFKNTNKKCNITDSSFPSLDYLHIAKGGIGSGYNGVVTPHRVKFLYCEGPGADYDSGTSYKYEAAFISDTVISKGYFNGNSHYRKLSGYSFTYLKLGIYTPEEKNFSGCGNTNTKIIHLCDTLNMAKYNYECLTNYYFWNKDSLRLPAYRKAVVDSLESAKNVIDFTSFPTVKKFTYSGKSPLETITFVNNTDAIDVKMDSTKFGVNVGEYSGIPFIASLKDWSCDLTWPYDYTIEKAPLTIMGNTITKEYGQPIPELSCTYIGLVNGETKDVLTTPVQIITTATEESPVGTYSIIPSNATSNNYDITFERGILNIIPASQSINWEQEFSKAKIGDIIELSATSSSGLKVSFSSSNSSVVDIYSSNGKWYAECIAAGNVRISAIQAGNNNYNAADDIVKRISVTDTDTSIGTVEIKSNANHQIYDIEGRKRDKVEERN